MSRPRRLRAWGMAAACVVAMWGTARAQPAAPPMDPRDAAEAVHTENEYPDDVSIADGQGSLRTFPPSLGEEGEADDRRGLQRSGRTDLEGHDAADGRNPGEPESDSGWQWPSLSGLGALGKILSWILLGLGAAALLALLGYLIYSVWPRGDRAAKDDTAPGEVVLVTADGLPFEVGDPEALAAEGRYSEAILALLVQSLRSVGWRPSTEGSLTAREVLWSLPASDSRRAPLARMVEGAERVRFAGAPATREAYEALRPHRDAVRAASASDGRDQAA